jgi:Pectate lyase superfamily protein
MHLVTPLIAGVRGCENGWAELYIRGTSTRATYYLDFEGTQAISTGANLTLDSNGGAEVYVNQLVDVQAKNSSGTVIRNFTAGSATSSVEVISDSFTGVDYSTGASATGKPTTVAAVLDLWNNSAGSADWKVSVHGVSTNIQDAITTIAGVFYNVKSTAYGAVGNGTDDDTAAIAAALTAAQNAGGGIVFFPAGTYKTTSQLSPGSKVSLMGAGPAATVISATHATQATLVFASASQAKHQTISGIGFTGTGTGRHINCTGAASLIVDNCTFSQGTNQTVIIGLSGASTDTIINACEFTISQPAGQSVLASTLGRIRITDCTHTVTATTWNPVDGLIQTDLDSNGDLFVRSNKFDFSAVTSGTATIVYAKQDSGLIEVSGCRFTDKGAAGPNVTCIAQDWNAATDALRLTEFNNAFGTIGGANVPRAYGLVWTHTTLASRAWRKLQTTDAASATLTLDADQYGVIVVRRTTAAGNQTLNLDAVTYEGAPLRVIYWNDDGGATTGTITWGTGIRSDTATYTVNANSATSFDFISVSTGSGIKWVQMSARNPNWAE